MTLLLIRLYRYFRNHQFVCWTSMAALFIFFGWFASRIHLEEDIDKLMPSSRNEDGTMKLAFADLKIKDKTFLLFEADNDSVTVDSLVSACDEFIDSLMVRDAKDSTIADAFYRIPDELMLDGVDYLTQHLPAYIDTAAYHRFDSLLTREHFAEQMQQNRDELEGEFGQMFPELIQLDPMGMRNVLADMALGELLSSAGNYKTVDSHFFVPDSTVCIAFITPRFSATNTGQGRAMFDMINSLITQFKNTHPGVTISYHGTPASGFYNSTQIKRDLTTTITGAVVLVLIFLFLCFRKSCKGKGLAFPLLLFLPVVFGTLFGLAMMFWIKGQFSLLALGIGGVVLGVALSYVLHVLVHQQYVENTEQMLRDQVKPVWLGCLTTIGSFAGLIFIKTDLLQDFGLFAAFAILGTTFFSLTYLPQMLDYLMTKRNSDAENDSVAQGKLWGWIGRVNAMQFDRNRPLIMALVIVALVGVVAYFIGGTHFDADMHNLGYDDPLTEHSEQLLRQKTYTGDKQKYFASRGKTMEEAIENFDVLDKKLDSLKTLGLVKDYNRTNQIFIPQRVQQERIEAWRDYWTQQRLDKVRSLTAQTAPAAGLMPDAFQTFFDAVEADYQPDPLYEADIIPQGYQSTMMEQSYGGDYLCFTSVRCANDSVRSSESDYMRICDAVASHPKLLVLDTYYYTTDTLMQMSEDFNVLQWLSMLFVLVVLLVSFHFNVKNTLLALMPIVLSWLIVLGAMNIFDMSFNLISIIISTFIFGIGVDYSIFVMNGLTDPNQQKLQYHKTAIFLSAFTLVVTVSSMLLAQHPAIKSVGFSTLVGLVSAVVLSYVLQPAIYRWLNRKKAA